jgi:hypothetical protein
METLGIDRGRSLRAPRTLYTKSEQTRLVQEQLRIFTEVSIFSRLGQRELSSFIDIF